MESRRLNRRMCTEKYLSTGNIEHLIDGVNIIARGRYDHVWHEIKEKIRTAMRKLINLTKENYTMNKQIIKGARDSLGVPIEPDDPVVIYRDFRGNDICAGDEYVEYQGDKISVDDMEYYAKKYIFSPIKIASDYE